MKKNAGWYLAGALLMAMAARAGIIIYSAALANNSALAYDSTYSVNLNTLGIGSLSAQAVYSSATVASSTFQDGSKSTGSFTVLSYAGLIAAKATNQVTVVQNTSLTGARLTLPGYVFTNGVDWATGNTSSNTAESIKTALATVPFLAVSRAGSVVYATAAANGSYYNSFYFASSNSSVTVATAYFTGGQDNASISINGVNLLQGSSFTASGSNSTTATSLAAAINNSTYLNTKIVAIGAGAIVYATSTLNGAKYNYLLTTSTPTALSRFASVMTNGTDAAFALGSKVFATASANSFTLALPLLYTQGTQAVGGLTDQTTYYSYPVTSTTFQLAKYSTSAVAGTPAGDFVSVTSTNSALSSSKSTYTLAPLGIAGTPSFKWQVSNDNSNWVDLAVSSVTVSAYTSGGATTIWSFGYIGTQYLRLNVVAPTAGGLNLSVTLIGTN